LLKKVGRLSSKYNLLFCKAHGLTLSIKVSKELGKQSSLIKDSHKAIKLWKEILDQPLAINGLIFAYIDLGLVFNDFNLNSLALKYLNKAESLISECSEPYYPSIKLYVAYTAVVLDSKKIDYYNNKVIKMANSKKDSLTLIPVMINIANRFINNRRYGDAEKKCLQALEISDSNKESIYKPYIYKALGKIFLNKNKFKQSENYFNKALDGFKVMNSDKTIPDVLYDISQIFIKQKKYGKGIDILNKSLKLSHSIKNYDLDCKVLKELSKIYKLNKDESGYLKTIKKLNAKLERHIENKEKVYSDTNANALQHLSKEFDLSLRKHKDLQLKIDIESKKRKLTTEALLSVSEREFLKNIISSLSNHESDNKKILKLCKDRIANTKEWNIFMKLFNDIHPKFNKYIIKKCPTITESELRICNLIKMSFSTLEITDILCISKRGVEQHRYRIRKKLNLNTDLTIFLQSL
jgi:tetratricopeptide (TPR) repeat protein/DNA-binding CsgD family transcriptional regulator